MDHGDQISDFADAYGSIAADNDEQRWAFGSGFDDPLAGLDSSVPSGVDGTDLATYCLMLGDDALVLSHRLQEWVTWAPELEDEVAIANIALDLLGQARLLLARAGKADGTDRSEDSYAYLRAASEFRNVSLVELDNGDFAQEVARLLAFSTYRLALLDRLRMSRDPVLAAIAAKGVKEVSYHRDYAARWMLRLGDGTDESHRRADDGVAAVWPYVGELFRPHEIEIRLGGIGIGVDPAALRAEFDSVVSEVLTAATLGPPSAADSGARDPGTPSEQRGHDHGGKSAAPAARGTRYELQGRAGQHSPALTELLAEMQSVARAHPGAAW